MVAWARCSGWGCKRETGELEPAGDGMYMRLPEGWTGFVFEDAEGCVNENYGGTVWCQDCKAIGEYFSDLCAGCVGSRRECAFWGRLERGSVNPLDLAALQTGRCPDRVNGTMVIAKWGLKVVDISDCPKRAIMDVVVQLFRAHQAALSRKHKERMKNGL